MSDQGHLVKPNCRARDPRPHGASVRRQVRARAWLPVLLIGLMPGAFMAQTGGRELEGLTINRIEFQGLERLPREAVLNLMELREGGPFSGETLERDLRMLAGHADMPSREPETPQPELEEERPPPPPRVFSVIPSVLARKDEAGGVHIVINGSENRRVTGLVFLGAVDFQRDELLPLIKTRSGAPADDFTLELDRQDLLRFYRSQGYHFASVGFLKELDQAGELILFTITEGPKVTIRKVDFEGAKSFEDSELMKEMPFVDTPGILSSQEYVADQVRRDAVQLTSWYQGRGFLDAQVTLLDAIPSADNETVDLKFLVEEGEPYTIRSLEVEGLTLMSVEEAFKDFRSEVGKAYEPGNRLQRDIRDLRDAIHEFGYTEARVTDVSSYDLDSNLVDVIISVEEGNLIRVGEITINGIVETQDRILRREIELFTGEPMNLRKLSRARQRIRALGFWQIPRGSSVHTDAIGFENFQVYKDAFITLKDTPREHVQDIIVNVEEADTGSLRFAAGVGSNAGLVGDITYSKTNFDPLDFPDGFDDILDAFTGGGQFLVMSLQPGTTFSRWRVAWGNPRIFDSLWSVVGEVYSVDWRREDWDENRLGYSVRVGRRISDDLSAAMTLRDEVVDVNDIDGDAPQLVFDFEGEHRITSLTLDTQLERLNDFLDPSDGYRIELTLEHAGLWGDIEFNKALGKGEVYFEMDEDDIGRLSTLRLQGSLGWASEFGSTNDIPVFERFFVGGQGSLRGFRYRGVGPMDNDSPIGGKAMWLASAEYQFPLWDNNIRGVAFLDTGSLAESWSSSEIWDMRASVGVGVRVVVPFLGERPLALDFALPVLKEDSDETQIISFSFGYR